LSLKQKLTRLNYFYILFFVFRLFEKNFLFFQMVRVRYTALAKLFAIIVFAFFILPSLFRIFNHPALPLDESDNQFGPGLPNENKEVKRQAVENNQGSNQDEVNLKI
jgi:hypothetical protein